MKKRNILKIGMATIACIGLTVSAFAQFPERGEWGRPSPLPQVEGREGFAGGFAGLGGEADGERNPFGRLGRLLDLTEDQIANAQIIADRHRDATQILRDLAADARAAAREQSETGSDATTIGQAILNARSFNEQLRAANEALLNELKTLLTSEQQSRRDTLTALREELGEGNERLGGRRGGRGRFGRGGDAPTEGQ